MSEACPIFDLSGVGNAASRPCGQMGRAGRAVAHTPTQAIAGTNRPVAGLQVMGPPSRSFKGRAHGMQSCRQLKVQSTGSRRASSRGGRHA